MRIDFGLSRIGSIRIHGGGAFFKLMSDHIHFGSHTFPGSPVKVGSKQRFILKKQMFLFIGTRKSQYLQLLSKRIKRYFWVWMNNLTLLK